MIPKELTFEGPYQRGLRGKKASLIQEWVSLQGFPTSVDGDFGPGTEKAVKRFQESQGLRVDGIVDQDTFTALTAPMVRALTPISGGGMTFNELVVAYAHQHLAEHPVEVGGANRGPWVRLYMNGDQGDWAFWCAGFVCFILRQAATTLNLPMPFESTSSCDELAARAKRKGLFVSEEDLDPTAMLPGSIFLDRSSPGDWTHTGLAIDFDDETFDTIEGNTNDDGHRDGYEVCKRFRGYRNKDFVKIA